MAYYFGGQPIGGWTDGYWNFGWADVLARSPAFNPLAYNPAIQYLPWNNNGVRFPNSSIGGTTNVAVGAKTEWDPRNLPPSMGVAKVYGVQQTDRAEQPASLTATANCAPGRAGRGLGDLWRVASREPGADDGRVVRSGHRRDLFSSTIVWENPNCASTSTPTNYFWYCPAGTAWSSPPEVCDATNDGMPSAGRDVLRCRPGQHPDLHSGSRPRLQYFSTRLPPGPPFPAMTGPAGEVCTSIVYYRKHQHDRPAPPARCPC